MTEDQRLLAAERVRGEIAEIERQAMSDVPGWPQYLTQLSDTGRESAMSAALSDRPLTFKRWRVLRLAARTLGSQSLR